MTESIRMRTENKFTRSLIKAVLRKNGGLTGKRLAEIAKEHGAGSARIKAAITHLHKTKVIWKVGKEWELRTETAVL